MFALFLLICTFICLSSGKNLRKTLIPIQIFLIFCYVVLKSNQLYTCYEYIQFVPGKYSFFTIIFAALGILSLYIKCSYHGREMYLTVEKSPRVCESISPNRFQSNQANPSSRNWIKALRAMMLVLFSGQLVFYLYLYIWIPTEKAISHMNVQNLKTVVDSVTNCLCWPIDSLVMMIVYNYVYGKIQELEANECTFDSHTVETTCESNLESVLPRVDEEENNSFRVSIVSIAIQELSSSGSKVETSFHDHMRVQSFRLVIDQYFLAPMSYFIIQLVLFLPITLVFYSSDVELRLFNVVSSCLLVTLVFIPVVVSITVSYRRKYILGRGKLKAMKSKCKKTKRKIGKIFLSSNDVYLESAVALFDFDSELILTIVDVIVLITTSLFTP